MIKEPLWTAGELDLFTSAQVKGQWFAGGVKIDSNDVQPGDLYFAMNNVDGSNHDQVADALARGASGVVVDTHNLDVSDNRLINSNNIRDTLRQAAAFARKRMPGVMIAVTGSAGKTSVVRAIRASLEHSGPTHSSIAGYDISVDIPLSLARMPRATRFATFKLGTSGPGELLPISSLVKPDIAVITSIGTSHLVNFEDRHEIVQEKASIFKSMQAGATAIISLDHEYSDLIVALARESGLKVVMVSARGEADVSVRKVSMTPFCSCVTADIQGVPMSFKVGQAGSHWVLNSLLTLAAVQEAGGDLGMAGVTLASMKAARARGQLHHLKRHFGNFSLLDDSYSANPLSVTAGLEHLSMLPTGNRGRRIAVLSDMAELGSAAEQEHLNLAQPIRSAGVSQALTLGPMMTQACHAADVGVASFDHVSEILPSLEQMLDADDVVFIKGANSSGLEHLIDGIVQASEFVPTDNFYQYHAAE